MHGVGGGGVAEKVVERDLQHGGAEPDEEDECGGGEGLPAGDLREAEGGVEGGESGKGFEEHGREDDPSGALGVEEFVAGKGGVADG